MYKFLLAAALLISSFSFSQDTTNDSLRQPGSIDKITDQRQSYEDSMRKADIDRMTRRSADFFVQYQKQQREKQKRQAILYIALGVFFLIVLIFGLRRRMKK